MKRVVASLLVRLERMPASTVVVAATNHPGMLGRATWRRFPLRLELETPTRNALTVYFQQRCRRSPRLRIKRAPDRRGTHDRHDIEDQLRRRGRDLRRH